MNLSVLSSRRLAEGRGRPGRYPPFSNQMILINLGGGWFGLVCLKCFSSAPDRQTNEERNDEAQSRSLSPSSLSLSLLWK